MKIFACAILMMFAVACGGKNPGGDDTGGDDAGGGDDGGGTVIDARVPPGCVPASPQCSNCKDDDGDGFIDSYDVECTGPLDNLENSFATGIPGDNMDAVNQDCFFDGNSGGGNDGCNIHVCCLLGAATKAECPIGANQYDPMACPPPIGTGTISQMCKDVCGKLAPPGCDCFGCCTLCDPATNQCYDIATNPNTSPNCTLQTLNDPNVCKRCTKVTDCGSPTCGGTSCILCPGQDPNDLPPGCGGNTMCPNGAPTCTSNADCGSGTYCDQGSMCCVGIIGLQ
ncbi:MAG TPA: hypothetical protein VNO30_02160 [Kofleriaceae bacterium]|nr:hypothetical protein [Kofleriaceae bacterium]